MRFSRLLFSLNLQNLQPIAQPFNKLQQFNPIHKTETPLPVPRKKTEEYWSVEPKNWTTFHLNNGESVKIGRIKNSFETKKTESYPSTHTTKRRRWNWNTYSLLWGVGRAASKEINQLPPVDLNYFIILLVIPPWVILTLSFSVLQQTLRHHTAPHRRALAGCRRQIDLNKLP